MHCIKCGDTYPHVKAKSSRIVELEAEIDKWRGIAAGFDDDRQKAESKLAVCREETIKECVDAIHILRSDSGYSPTLRNAWHTAAIALLSKLPTSVVAEEGTAS